MKIVKRLKRYAEVTQRAPRIVCGKTLNGKQSRALSSQSAK
jgi:hypothetical protein